MSKIKLITLIYRSEYESFDTEELDLFQEQHEILSYTEHFFMARQVPCLLLVLNVRGRTEKAPVGGGDVPYKKDWREELGGEERQLYEQLRVWRLEQATQEGVPAYAVLTNRLLAEIVKARPGSLEQLGKIRGIGQVTLEKYGRLIVQTLHNTGSEGVSASSNQDGKGTGNPKTPEQKGEGQP